MQAYKTQPEFTTQVPLCSAGQVLIHYECNVWSDSRSGRLTVAQIACKACIFHENRIEIPLSKTHPTLTVNEPHYQDTYSLAHRAQTATAETKCSSLTSKNSMFGPSMLPPYSLGATFSNEIQLTLKVTDLVSMAMHMLMT